MAEFISGDFNTLREPWNRLLSNSTSKLLFSSPEWSEQWWQYFGADSQLYLGAVKDDGRYIGIAPLRRKDGIMYFIGSDNVCDFLDFIVEQGKEEMFFQTVFAYLSNVKIEAFDLSPLLPDSTAKRFLPDTALSPNLSVSCAPVDVTVRLDIPPNLATYHSILTAKQRHELLRKERRLHEEGDITFSIKDRASQQDIEIFLRFFRQSREDKNKFLTTEMESFFRAVIRMAEANRILRLGILALNNVSVAATLCFDYQNNTYLYNSGYNPDYRWLSVGLLSKYYHIKHSIESGKTTFDFLKGAEKYKYHLGGKDVPLYQCMLKNKQVERSESGR